MFHYDYQWYLTKDKIVLDEELNTDKLGWKSGDLFKFVNVNGRQLLIKIDPLVKFLEDGAAKNEQGS